jgi:hypothetical protein
MPGVLITLSKMLRLLTLLTLLMVSAIAAAPAAESFVPAIATLDSKDLKPGMKGYGLTVFEGTKVERFDVEIKGVVASRLGGGDLIICELSHPKLKDIGVVAGMSGSPVFINDKLIGAVSYGWGFSVRPICGVTPIKSMLTVMNLVTKDAKVTDDEVPPTARAWPELRSTMAERTPSTDIIRLDERELARLGLSGADVPSSGVSMEPLGTPLLVSTTHGSVMKAVEGAFAGTLLHPVMTGLQGGMGGDKTGDPVYQSIQPENGCAFSIVLCEGDLQITGLGTLTYVEGDRMIGFGHPMFGVGAVDAPMRLSDVVTVVPSLMRPFKMGNTIKEMGALRQDRLPAVGGSLSGKSHMVPVTVRIKAPESGDERTFNFSIWDDRRFLPFILPAAFLEAMEGTTRLDGPMNIRLSYDIEFADGRKVSRTDYLSREESAPLYAAGALTAATDVYLNNPFESVRLKSVTARAVVGPRQQVMLLNKVLHEDVSLHPGGMLKGEILYDRWRQGQSKLPFTFRLPADIRPGNYELHVVDANSRANLERTFRPELNVVESFNDLMRSTEPSFPGNVVYLLLVDNVDHVVLGESKLPALPASVAQVTKATARDTKQATSSRATLLREERRTFDAEVAGSSMISFRVEERGAERDRQPPPPPREPMPILLQ